MSARPLIAARNRVALAVRRRNPAEELAARQDLGATKIAVVITQVEAGPAPLRPDQRDALVAQLLAGGAA